MGGVGPAVEGYILLGIDAGYKYKYKVEAAQFIHNQ